jgi:hypothetical protein
MIVWAHRIRPVLRLMKLDCIHIVVLLLLLLAVGGTCRLLVLRRRMIGLRRGAFQMLMLLFGLLRLLGVGWLGSRG